MKNKTNEFKIKYYDNTKWPNKNPYIHGGYN